MRITRHYFILILLCLLTPMSAIAMEDGQVFQAWRGKCVADTKSGKSNCHIFQDLLHKESGKRILHVAIGSLADKKPLAMIVTLPLGVLLPQGLTIKIDKASAQIPLQFCVPSGCQAAFELKSDWLKSMKAGKKAEYIFYNTQGQAISIPVSLKGISKAIKALRNQ